MMRLRFDAGELSNVWRSVAIASSQDTARPQLYRTISCEIYNGRGVRLTATDSWILVTGWVPALGDVDEIGEVPEFGEVCDEQWTIQDVDNRVHALMVWAAKVVKKCAENGDPIPQVQLSIGPDAGSGFLPGLGGGVATFTSPEIGESVKAPLHEGAFPDWRRVWPRTYDRHVGDVMGFGTQGLVRFSRLSEIWGAASLSLTLHGVDKPVEVDLVGGMYEQRLSAVEVRGLGMPVKLVANAAGVRVAVAVDNEAESSVSV